VNNLDQTILVALISLAGTFIGSFSGLQLIKYRLDKQEQKIDDISQKTVTKEEFNDLSKRVDKHNNIIERTYILETEMANVKEDIKEIKKV